MKETIKKDRLKFKIGSFEWINFFGLPIGFFIYGLFPVYDIIQNGKSQVLQTQFIGFIIAAVLSYYLQLNRLKFKVVKLNIELHTFKNELRDLLISNNWSIEYDNKQFLQATYTGSLFSMDMLTVQFSEKQIKYNVIWNPNSRNSIAALFVWNLPGKRMIEKIEALNKVKLS